LRFIAQKEGKKICDTDTPTSEGAPYAKARRACRASKKKNQLNYWERKSNESSEERIKQPKLYDDGVGLVHQKKKRKKEDRAIRPRRKFTNEKGT